MRPNPYDFLPPVPPLHLRSNDVEDGHPLALAHYSAMSGLQGADDVSPHLAWSSAPEGTQSFVITMFDPDAPTPSGFWHWALVDVPSTVSELARGAARAGLPGAAFHVPNDARVQQYVGAAPPPGTGRHRYFIAVSALDVKSVAELGFGKEGTPALLNFHLSGHVLARGVLAPYAGV
jgi:Raf kinase inhibitor-like YbhB/YbcL family protein